MPAGKRAEETSQRLGCISSCSQSPFSSRLHSHRLRVMKLTPTIGLSSSPPPSSASPTAAGPKCVVSRVKCRVSHLLNGTGRATTMYAVSVDDAPAISKRFSAFVELYENVHRLITADKILAPPKKRLLGSDSRLVEKRRIWVEQFVQQAVTQLPNNVHVVDMLGHTRTDSDSGSGADEEHPVVNLGTSERKTAKPSDFDFIKTVGKGYFGRVFQVRHKADGQIYAMKVLQKEQIKRKNEQKHVMAERNVLKDNLPHPFLVSLHFSFQTKDKLYFVLDFLNGGELFSHLQREKRFAEPRARFYAACISSALGYLHNHNIIYRDLKPENLMLDKRGYLILTDFGLCKENMKLKDTTHTHCGTPEYFAPEIVLKKPYDRTVDWWCLGSVLYEMFFGLPPFFSKNQQEMYDRIVNQPLRFKHSISPFATDMITRLLNKDRLRRMGAKRDFDEVREHEFFSSIDFDRLERREVPAPWVPPVKGEADNSLFAEEFTGIRVNEESLKPTTLNHQADPDFPNFTYAPDHMC